MGLGKLGQTGEAMKNEEARLKFAVKLFKEINHENMSIFDDVTFKMEKVIGICDTMSDNLYRRNINNADMEAESMGHVFSQLQDSLIIIKILIENGMKDKYE